MKEFVEKLIGRLENRIKYNELCHEEFPNAKTSLTYEVQINAYKNAIEIVNQLAEEIVMGNISDGYHTFNELYHHRAVLFAVICNSNKEQAWKSKLHDTGDMYEGMFIVGIETPEGQATYHYDINPYWDMFKVKELPKAPKWDGHTPDEAIRRIRLLAEEMGVSKMENTTWIPCSERLPEKYGEYLCCNRYGEFIIGYPVAKHSNDGFYIETDTDGLDYVVAWMPLPAPYQKGE